MAQEPSAIIAPQRILVVDDEPPIREILKFQLENAGFVVATAGNGDVENWFELLDSWFDDVSETPGGLNGYAP